MIKSSSSITALQQRIQLLKLLCDQISLLIDLEDERLDELVLVLKKYPRDNTYQQQRNLHQHNKVAYQTQLTTTHQEINTLKHHLNQLGN